ncbi:hypothetical protein B0H12DRAFT_1076667 [Mycena haematopus]|nr:hypothetical protein B0H12DRAFT_1076667 [Mycena haematopus]
MKSNGNFSLGAGVWTDEALARSLATYGGSSSQQAEGTRGGFDETDQLEAYLRWYQHGVLSAIGRCFDIGSTTRRALGIYKDALKASGALSPAETRRLSPAAKEKEKQKRHWAKGVAPYEPIHVPFVFSALVAYNCQDWPATISSSVTAQNSSQTWLNSPSHRSEACRWVRNQRPPIYYLAEHGNMTPSGHWNLFISLSKFWASSSRTMLWIQNITLFGEGNLDAASNTGRHIGSQSSPCRHIPQDIFRQRHHLHRIVLIRASFGFHCGPSTVEEINRSEYSRVEYVFISSISFRVRLVRDLRKKLVFISCNIYSGQEFDMYTDVARQLFTPNTHRRGLVPSDVSRMTWKVKAQGPGNSAAGRRRADRNSGAHIASKAPISKNTKNGEFMPSRRDHLHVMNFLLLTLSAVFRWIMDPYRNMAEPLPPTVRELCADRKRVMGRYPPQVKACLSSDGGTPGAFLP